CADMVREAFNSVERPHLPACVARRLPTCGPEATVCAGRGAGEAVSRAVVTPRAPPRLVHVLSRPGRRGALFKQAAVRIRVCPRRRSAWSCSVLRSARLVSSSSARSVTLWAAGSAPRFGIGGATAHACSSQVPFVIALYDSQSSTVKLASLEQAPF